MERFVVAGGSVAGMGAALALARAGAEVTLVERDVIPPAEGPEEAFATERPGVPQAHFLHAFLGKMVQVLESRLPDVLEGVLAAGGQLASPPMTELNDIRMLLARRSTVEWVMRRVVLAEPGVTYLAGRHVTAVTSERGDSVPHVSGAVLDDGSRVEGTVVAATGRRPDLNRWLSPLGVEITEDLVQSELVYITRWYWAPDYQMGTNGLLRDLGFMSYLVVPAEAGTLAVAVGLPPEDKELRACMLTDDGFDSIAARLPGLDEELRSPSIRPLRSSAPMAGLVNRLRHFTGPSGEPLITGFHAVGDAHTCTNPAYGRGCALALVEATLLADAITASSDPLARSRAYEDACKEQVEPWYHSSVMMDQARLAMRKGDWSGGQNPAAGGQPDVLGILVAAAAGLIDDPVIIGGFARLLHLMVTPQQLFGDPEFTGRLFHLASNPPELPKGPVGPTREELIQAAADAA